MSTTSGMNYCAIHGSYFGWTCPGCNAAPVPTGQATALDPTPTLMRIADALERIAAQLEKDAA